MNEIDSRRLLKDILAEGEMEDFRACVLNETLRAVRGRRRLDKVKRGVVPVLIVLLALFLWRPARTPAPGSSATQPIAKPRGFGVVNSNPLPAAMMVETRLGSVQVVDSVRSGLVEVETRIGGHFAEVDDERLLMLAGRAAALIRRSPNDAELLWANPEGLGLQ